MPEEELAKDLGPLAALTIGVGTMIGAGIFVLPGPAAAEAGPIVVLSFVIGGAIALFTALSASELGTAMPKAGGAYYYINHALGPLFGSIAGWGNWVGLAFASAFYALGFGQYVAEFLAVPGVELVVVSLTPAQVGGVVAGLVFVGVNYVGAKETGRLQNVIVVALVAILATFAVVGAFRADPATLFPLTPPGRGVEVVLPATALVFVSFIGFVQITSVGEEIKEPGRNLPLALIGSVVVVTVVYALVLLVLFSVADLSVVAGNETAVVDVARLLMGGVGVAALTFAGLLATASSANASILASSRINFAMGRDRIVSDWLNDIHDQFATPYRSIALTGALILVFVLVGDVATLAKAGSVLHLVIYGLLNVALVVMREAAPSDYDPDYRVPLYPVVPVLGALTSFALIAFMAPVEIGLSLLFVVGAVLWYALYARRHVEESGVLTEYVLDRADRMPDAAVTAATSVQPDGGQYRVLVSLANPANETDLVTLASALASARDGIVDAVHIVTVPDQTPLEFGAAYAERVDGSSEQLLARAREDAETFGVPVETSTIVSHRSYEEIFDAARAHDADVVVMGWGEDAHGSPGRAETAIDELAADLPCDFLVLKDRGFDPASVLVPTAGGPDSALSASVAETLRAESGSDVTLLHVVDADERGTGEAFLADWASEHGLGDAARVVETGDVETAIERAAAAHSLLVLGATERGLLSRLVRGSVVMDVVDDVDCSVLLAEKARSRPLRERLFGR